jgi:hypothetical protein
MEEAQGGGDGDEWVRGAPSRTRSEAGLPQGLRWGRWAWRYLNAPEVFPGAESTTHPVKESRFQGLVQEEEVDVGRLSGAVTLKKGLVRRPLRFAAASVSCSANPFDDHQHPNICVAIRHKYGKILVMQSAV